MEGQQWWCIGAGATEGPFRASSSPPRQNCRTVKFLGENQFLLYLFIYCSSIRTLCTWHMDTYGYMWIQIHIMGGFGGYKAWATCFFYVQCSAVVIWRLDLERQPKHTHWCHDGNHWDCGNPGVVPSHSEWWDLACTRCTEFPLGASISVSSNRDLRMHRGSEWEISWDMQWHNGQVEGEWLNDPADVPLNCQISRPQHSESQRLILETLLVFRLYSKDSLHEVSPVLFKHTKSSPQHIWRRLVLLEKRREIPGSWASLPKDCQTLWILNRLVESLKGFVTCLTYDCWAIPLPAPEFLANRKAIHLNTPDNSSCRASTYLDIASFQHD